LVRATIAVATSRSPARSDAATVTIEVVSGVTVVATFDVPSGAATDILLPDADASYDVRVRQADAAGNAAVTPSTTVTLDRSGPVAGGAPTVTGNATAQSRHVMFTRAGDAVSARVEIVDAGGGVVGTVDVPAGGDADVTLPDTDGTYRVRVRQTDADGNAAVTPSTTVSLDRVAPAAGGAPTVTGAVNVRVRHVVFTRASDAAGVTIELLDASNAVVGTVSVPSGNAGDVTLPDVDGSYRVWVRQTDAAGNDAVSPSTTVSLDRSAPSAGGAPGVSGAEDARLRHVVFTRASDAVTVTIEVVDGNGTVVGTYAVAGGGEGDITLPDSDGTYRVCVRQTDAGGNAGVTSSTSVSLVRETGGAGTGDGGGGGGSGGTGTGTGTTPTPPTTPPATDSGAPAASDPGGLGALLTDCYGGSTGLVLTDVRAAGTTVALSGLSIYAPGTKVTIVDSKQRTVATTTATANGSFTATAAAPAKAETKSIRYTAVINTKLASKALKLRRATTLNAVTVTGDVATLSGKIDLSSPKGKRAKLALGVRGGRGANACKAGGGKLKFAGKPKLNLKTGAYSVKVKLPAGTTGKVAVRVRVSGSLKSASLYTVR
jgi:hypothetical protein